MRDVQSRGTPPEKKECFLSGIAQIHSSYKSINALQWGEGRQGPRLSIRIDIWILPSDTIRG